jgi:hypothetical protein
MHVLLVLARWRGARGGSEKQRWQKPSHIPTTASSNARVRSAAGVGENCGRDKWPRTGHPPCGSDRRAGRLQHQGSKVSVRRPLPWRCSNEACAALSRDGEHWVLWSLCQRCEAKDGEKLRQTTQRARRAPLRLQDAKCSQQGSACCPLRGWHGPAASASGVKRVHVASVSQKPNGRLLLLRAASRAATSTA